MRKKIAIFTNGWSGEYLQEIGQGILAGASIADVDIFTFTSYSMRADATPNQNAEFSIFKLADLSDFDGVIALSSTFNLNLEFEYLEKEIARTNIPAISLEYKLKGADYLGSDDYSGMFNLANHLIEKHSVRNILFLGGMEDHQGSNIRLKAVKDALNAHKLSLPSENINYCLFAAVPAVDAVKNWLNEHDNKLPDAIVCANDIMAIGVCNWLGKHNISVPNDVIVTGFDCLKAGQDLEPSLTTVNREWYSMGIKAIERILAKIAGKKVPANEELPTHLICGESCGCIKTESHSPSKLLRKTDTNEKIDGFSCDQHFRHMFSAMRKASNLEALSNELSAFFIKEGWLEGDDILIAMNPNFFNSDNWNALKSDDYPKEMDLVCNIKDKTQGPVVRMAIKDIVFELPSHKESCGSYFYVPIRVDDVCPGFAVLSCDFSIFQKDVLYLWCRHMSQYTEQVKSNAVINQLNKRLQALSVTDALTGIYNRTGCESIMYPAITENQLRDGRSIFMLVDVDHLKYINDNFGHGDGDIAIKTSVKAMQSALPADFMIGRYGGDEFLIAGFTHEKVDLDLIIKKMIENAAYESRLQKLPYTVSISVGAIQLDAGEDFDVNECIKHSDQRMYKMKTIHHEENSL